MKVFQFHKIQNFPTIFSDYGWESITQPILPTIVEDDEPITRIKYLGESEHPHFLRYSVKHETKMKQKVRVNHEERDEIITIQNFDMYLPRNHNYAWIISKSSYCIEMLKRIRTKQRGFTFDTREIDLLKLKDQFQMNIKGGWFTSLDIEDVSAAAIFGNSVSGSTDWKRYENNGKIAALNLDIALNGFRYCFQVGHSGSITLYQNFLEKDALEFVEKINDILEKFSTPYSYASRSRRGLERKV